MADMFDMSNYRRRRVPGGTYFFTVNLQDRTSDLLVREIDLLRHVTALTKARWPFDIPEAVILPNQLHMIWTLPAGDVDYSKRWRLLKSTFSRHVPAPVAPRPSLARKGEKGIWQRRFWEHHIRDAADYDRHAAFIHSAPVVAGLVRAPQDWRFSSASLQRVAA